MAPASSTFPSRQAFAGACRMVCLGLALSLAAGWSGAVHAAGDPVAMRVSARVAVSLGMRVISMPVSAQVSAADIARGHMDLQAPLAVAVRTNLATPYRVVVYPALPTVAAVHVVSEDTATLGPDGHAELQRQRAVRPMDEETITMSLRIRLAPGTVPGTMTWPVRVALLPS